MFDPKVTGNLVAILNQQSFESHVIPHFPIHLNSSTEIDKCIFIVLIDLHELPVNW